MPLIPLTIPAGVYRNGTDFQQSGRWRDANLVRWADGSMRPMGGWRKRLTSVYTNPPRGMLAWEDLSGDRWIAAGTYDKLYVTTGGNITTEITPAGLTSGKVIAEINTGFGGSFFGSSFFGVERPDAGNFSEATTWSIDNWGENLVACSVADGRIFQWELDTLSAATAVSNAPINNLAVHVTGERFLMALGAGGNPRLVKWSDREDNTTWAAAATNEAGDLELQTAGQIMCGVRVRGQSLILTDQDAHTATYHGPPFVYGFEKVGQSCGVTSRKAVAVVDAGAFWMGSRSFFAFSGGAVEALPCDVSDYVFDDINRSQLSLVHAVHMAEFGEIWWHYPSGSSNECDKYVVFDYAERHWTIGAMERTSGIARGVFKYPLWADASGNVYEHEVGLDYEDAAIFAESGPISLGSGDQVMKVTKIIPDELTQGDVTVTLKSRFHPNDTERSYGPYTMSTPTDVRMTGRQVRMRIDGNRLSAWRVGTMRLDVVAGGKR